VQRSLQSFISPLKVEEIVKSLCGKDTSHPKLRLTLSRQPELEGQQPALAKISRASYLLLLDREAHREGINSQFFCDAFSSSATKSRSSNAIGFAFFSI